MHLVYECRGVHCTPSRRCRDYMQIIGDIATFWDGKPVPYGAEPEISQYICPCARRERPVCRSGRMDSPYIDCFRRIRSLSTAGASPRPTVSPDGFCNTSSANVGQGLAPAAQQKAAFCDGSRRNRSLLRAIADRPYILRRSLSENHARIKTYALTDPNIPCLKRQRFGRKCPVFCQTFGLAHDIGTW